jgi:hypothetical protein
MAIQLAKIFYAEDTTKSGGVSSPIYFAVLKLSRGIPIQVGKNTGEASVFIFKV